MANKTLHRIESREFPDGQTHYLIYVAATGTVIHNQEKPIKIDPTNRDTIRRINQSIWKTWAGALTAEQCAALEDGDLRIADGEPQEMAGDSWSEIKPTVRSAGIP